MKLKKIGNIHYLLNKTLGLDYKHSYSQTGEDILIEFIFNCLGVGKITYLDIGAFHPRHLSNTYLFYEKGNSGVCVEPDPSQFAIIKRARKNDICLNIGVGLTGKREAEYFVMSDKVYNTFSRDEAEKLMIFFDGLKIEKIIKVDLLPVNSIIEKNFRTPPDLVSLDTEGLDFEILESFDFKRFRPSIFCIETLSYLKEKKYAKDERIISLMRKNGYFVFADTFINTIFVDKNSWEKNNSSFFEKNE